MLLDDAWVLDLDTLEWKALQLKIKASFGFATHFLKSNLLLIGGAKNNRELSTQIQTFDLYRVFHSNSKFCNECLKTVRTQPSDFNSLPINPFPKSFQIELKAIKKK